jgi:hypothetical protein
VPQDSGEQNKKLPERADNLRVDLPFEDAIRAALTTKPPPALKKKRRTKH